ncbi:PAS domain-containing protein [Zooshikella marina]|uniref:ATP-binding protein n=1 Tax=Zooshikella ganghwensis TaxID=202772 RepID=UPI001BAE6BCB|nr:ATP-binding protein [Zooshikella ganghwensis]MBU2704757.1 PAS domain-containing protein [Zooshikella ganghwensis]
MDNDYNSLFYHALLDAIQASVLVVDDKLRILSANRNFLEKGRRSASNTLGRPLAEVIPRVILENTDIEGRIQDVAKSGVPLHGQRMTYRAPGIPMRIYYYSLQPIKVAGHRPQIMILLEDITEQVRLSEEVRRVERHLASVVNSASDMVLSIDIEGRILTWNLAAEQLTGFSFFSVKNTQFLKWCAESHQAEVRKMLAGMLSEDLSRTAEWPLIKTNGSSILVSWVLSPMKDDHGKTIGVVAVGRDLTEQKKMELQLRQSQKLAALGVMAGGIAHEIRNPLAVCSSAAQFLLEDNLEEPFRKECARKICIGIQRTSTIIENLLRFARPSTKTEMAEVELGDVIKQTLNLIENETRLQKIAIDVQFDGKEVMVRGEPTLLQQVFMNLFLNAINAMPNGGKLTIRVYQLDMEVFVEVIDTGVGIPSNMLEQIFDPFHTTSVVGEGTGLGLSICYSIVRQHLGGIDVDSSPEWGSRFTIRLPKL